MLQSLNSPVSALVMIFTLGACSPVIVAESTDDASAGSDIADDSSDPASDCSAGFDVYVDEVHPVLQEFCAACHGTNDFGAPVFLADDPVVSYLLIKGTPSLYQAPSESMLLLKGEHMGPGLSPEDSAVVERWLSIEASPACCGR